jgi:hypothetical protein
MAISMPTNINTNLRTVPASVSLESIEAGAIGKAIANNKRRRACHKKKQKIRAGNVGLPATQEGLGRSGLDCNRVSARRGPVGFARINRGKSQFDSTLGLCWNRVDRRLDGIGYQERKLYRVGGRFQPAHGYS